MIKGTCVHIKCDLCSQFYCLIDAIKGLAARFAIQVQHGDLAAERFGQTFFCAMFPEFKYLKFGEGFVSINQKSSFGP